MEFIACKLIPVSLPQFITDRLSKRQTNRCNIVADTPEEYFRLAVFVQLIDSFSVQLKDRLLENRNVLNDVMCLLPARNVSNQTVIRSLQFRG